MPWSQPSQASDESTPLPTRSSLAHSRQAAVPPSLSCSRATTLAHPVRPSAVPNVATPDVKAEGLHTPECVEAQLWTRPGCDQREHATLAKEGASQSTQRCSRLTRKPRRLPDSRGTTLAKQRPPSGGWPAALRPVHAPVVGRTEPALREAVKESAPPRAATLRDAADSGAAPPWKDSGDSTAAVGLGQSRRAAAGAQPPPAERRSPLTGCDGSHVAHQRGVMAAVAAPPLRTAKGEAADEACSAGAEAVRAGWRATTVAPAVRMSLQAMAPRCRGDGEAMPASTAACEAAVNRAAARLEPADPPCPSSAAVTAGQAYDDRHVTQAAPSLAAQRASDEACVRLPAPPDGRVSCHDAGRAEAGAGPISPPTGQRLSAHAGGHGGEGHAVEDLPPCANAAAEQRHWVLREQVADTRRLRSALAAVGATQTAAVVATEQLTAALVARASSSQLLAAGVAAEGVPLLRDVAAALCADTATLSPSERFLLTAPRLAAQAGTEVGNSTTGSTLPQATLGVAAQVDAQLSELAHGAAAQPCAVLPGGAATHRRPPQQRTCGATAGAPLREAAALVSAAKVHRKVGRRDGARTVGCKPREVRTEPAPCVGICSYKPAVLHALAHV